MRTLTCWRAALFGNELRQHPEYAQLVQWLEELAQETAQRIVAQSRYNDLPSLRFESGRYSMCRDILTTLYGKE
jgi:hypothetical protein